MSAHRLRLTLAVGNYDINRALLDGSVRPEGIELTVVTEPSPALTTRARRETLAGAGH